MTQIDDFIARCDSAIDGVLDKEQKESLALEILTALKSELRRDRASDCVVDRDFTLMRSWLRSIKERRDHEVAIATAQSGVLSIEQTASATAVATVEMSLSQTMSHMWSLPDSVLNTDDKKELSNLLTELESSRGDDKSKALRAAKAVGTWLFDKGAEAIPTVMPFVVQVVRPFLSS